MTQPHRAGATAAATWAGLLLLGVALTVAVRAGDLRAAAGTAIGAFALSLLGSALVVRGAKALAPGALLLGLVVLRLIALLGQPTLSDDIHRYVHEGRAHRLGIAVPYSTPPAAVTPPPDDGTTARVNHPDVPAAYPPGSELILWATVSAGDALGRPSLPLRVLLVLADLSVLLVLYRRRAQLPSAFALYGSHPLPLLELSLGAHLDALGVAAVVAGVLTARPFLSGVLMGLAAHVKPVAALALLGAKRQAFGWVLAGFSVAVVLPAVPYLVAGAPLQRGFLEYTTRWKAAPFVYAALEAPLEPFFERRAARNQYAHLHLRSDGVLVEEGGRPFITLGAGTRSERPVLLDGGFIARVLAGALLALALTALARSRAQPHVRVGTAFALFWLLAPTVHPWYLTWLVPFAALTSSRALWAFSAASPLLYQPVFGFALDGTWREDAWPRVAVVAALVGGLLLDQVGRRARAGRG